MIRPGTVTGEQPAHEDRPLILDELSARLERFRLLQDSDDGEADRLLDELGASGRVEQEMVAQMAAGRPLARPDRVPEAHAVAMHALEVLSRNGSRPPSQLRVGPLTPIARVLVQQVVRVIVHQHQNRVVDALRDLYARRLAWIPAGDRARGTLVRARIDVERASAAYKKKGGGVPTFLVGGAAVSSLAKVAQDAAGAALGSRVGVGVAVAFTFVVLAAASWVILQGAAVARRRIRLTMDRPLGALWETVGWAGHPPKDSAREFASIAIVLTFVGWLVIPVGVFLLFTVF